MLHKINLFQTDLEKYSYSDLKYMAKFLHLDPNRPKHLLVNISIKQFLFQRNGNLDLQDLPSEIILNIVKDLTIQDIGRLCTTASQLSWVCKESETWKYIYKRDLSNKNLQKMNIKKQLWKFII